MLGICTSMTTTFTLLSMIARVAPIGDARPTTRKPPATSKRLISARAMSLSSITSTVSAAGGGDAFGCTAALSG